jgi:hypothetical protein
LFSVRQSMRDSIVFTREATVSRKRSKDYFSECATEDAPETANSRAYNPRRMSLRSQARPCLSSPAVIADRRVNKTAARFGAAAEGHDLLAS